MYKIGKFFNIPNKYYEIELTKINNSSIFSLYIKFSKYPQEDHAGFYFEFSIIKLLFAVRIYDTRHIKVEF